jgi:hypothetical protein
LSLMTQEKRSLVSRVQRAGMLYAQEIAWLSDRLDDEGRQTVLDAIAEYLRTSPRMEEKR